MNKYLEYKNTFILHILHQIQSFYQGVFVLLQLDGKALSKDILELKKRYAYLANENLRNFHK